MVVVDHFPFTEVGDVRTFAETVTEEDLQWHWDDQDRIVTPLHETDWELQLDNQLPQSMHPGVSYYIPAGVWHRVLRGTGALEIEVLKFNDATSAVPRSE